MKVVCLFIVVFIASVQSKIDHEQSIVKEKKKDDHELVVDHKDIDHLDHSKLYTELFKRKRREQHGAIQSISGIDPSKQRPFLEDVLKNIKEILEDNRFTLENLHFTPKDPFPHDSDILKESLSKILENTAFFSDLSLRFPPVFVKKMAKDRKLRTVVVWAYNFSKESGLMDPDTLSIVELMAQQHEIIPKTEGYINPFDKKVAKEDLERAAVEEHKRRQEEKQKEKKSEKKQNKAGPSITKTEL